MTPKHPKAKAVHQSGIFSGLTSFRALEERISNLSDNKAKGDAFEVFVEAYLATQPFPGVKDVWPGESVPPALQGALGLTRSDMGVDGVFQKMDGGHAVYQVKFRTNRTSLSWRELSTFFGLAGSSNISERVLITNTSDISDVAESREKYYAVRGIDFDELCEQDFDNIDAWLAGSVVHVNKKMPKPHQLHAIEPIVTEFQNQDRATTVLACGSGKTLIGLWAAEKLEAGRVLVLVPSLSLLRQTLHDWLRDKSSELSYLCVCSDESVDKGSDGIAMNASELGVPVTTSPDDITKFLTEITPGTKVIFSTYQSAEMVGEAVKGASGFDLGIFDEAHKTAGKDDRAFAYALSDENIKIKKRLFMTATPRHFNILKKDKDGNAAAVYSMDQPDVYGRQCYTLSFNEAAGLGVIVPFKVIISVITSQQLTRERLKNGTTEVEGDSIKAVQVAHQLALIAAINQNSVKKVFSFHSSVAAAKSFVANGGEGVQAHLPSLQTFHVNGEMATDDRQDILRRFKDSECAVVTNARCLTEGVDVPGVDMVAFISPKKSVVDIVQAAGRAMRTALGKTLGYIMIPLYLEQEQGESIEQALENTDLKYIWSTLQALQEQDEVLADIVTKMRQEKGRTKGFSEIGFREKVQIIGDTIDLESLKTSINARALEALSVTWDERFGELEAFKIENGHCDVPRSYRILQLVTWVGNQRARRERLTPDQLERLNELGFVWDPLAVRWEDNLKNLQDYKKLNGHCNVPAHDPKNPVLGAWVSLQRANKNLLDTERFQQLLDLGFNWDPFAIKWEENFKALSEFKAQNGHCRVTAKFRSKTQLRSWVVFQRVNKGQLSLDNIRKLDELGFDWDPVATTLEENFKALEEFKAQNGHCNVPAKYPENPKFGHWVHTQRGRKEELSVDQLRRFSDLGFDWDPIATAWDVNFKALEEFKAHNGHCEVTWDNSQHRQLHTWVSIQRRGKDDLTPERLRRLIALGLSLDPVAFWFEENFRDLTEFRKQNGHCNIPQSHPNKQLSTWVHSYRTRKDRLPSDQLKRLNDLGFDWDPHATLWEKNFRALEDFKSQTGHCRVPDKTPQIGSWVGRQRARKDRLSPDQIRRLDDLGFEWDPLKTITDENFRALAEFKMRTGHCNVPQNYSENRQLSVWVWTRRRSKDALMPEQITQLDELGFDWDPIATEWEKNFKALAIFRKKTGHCKVPSNYIENPQLTTWIRNQRRHKNSLSTDQLKRLNDLGFDWDPKSKDDKEEPAEETYKKKAA